MVNGHDAAFGAFVAFAPPAPVVTTGTLAGLRVAVKDNIAVSGMPYTAGVPCFSARRAESDAVAVVRLRNAGAAIVGVTRTDAGGLGVLTPDVVNPSNPDLVAGGSSGGSAAAVAGGFAAAALGTDTGGSVRIPAACCGLFAFKPTHGRVPAGGVWPLAASLEDVGVIASSAEHLRVTSSALLEDRPIESLPMPVVGFDRARLAGCDERVRASFERSLARLADGGCELRELRLPERDAACSAHARIVLREALEVYGQRLRAGDEAGLGPTIWRALQLAAGDTTQLLEEAKAYRYELAAAWLPLAESVDCVALPTLPVPPPRRGVKRIVLGDLALPAAAVLTAETSLANLLGLPAVAIPAHGEASVQILGRAGEDSTLLAHAAAVASIIGGP